MNGPIQKQLPPEIDRAEEIKKIVAMVEERLGKPYGHRKDLALTLQRCSAELEKAKDLYYSMPDLENARGLLADILCLEGNKHVISAELNHTGGDYHRRDIAHRAATRAYVAAYEIDNGPAILAGFAHARIVRAMHKLHDGLTNYVHEFMGEAEKLLNEAWELGEKTPLLYCVIGEYALARAEVLPGEKESMLKYAGEAFADAAAIASKTTAQKIEEICGEYLGQSSLSQKPSERRVATKLTLRIA